MSALSKITLMSAVVFTIGTVSAVHFTQYKERERMHQGVLRDEARQSAKQRQDDNAREYEAQLRLDQELRSQQETMMASAPTPPRVP